ncbi:MAG: Swt1 family HEPN domain-containing protein [Gammaproteobacteria bacterium]
MATTHAQSRSLRAAGAAPTHTVAQVLDRFELEDLPNLGERTKKDYVRHLSTLRSQFGHRQVHELRRAEIQTFLNVSKGQIQRNRIISVLSSAISQAVNWGWVESNVCKGVPRNKPKGRKRSALTQQEFEDAKKIAPLRVRLTMDLARQTKQGQSAIVELCWSQVDDEKAVIRFRDKTTDRRTDVRITPEIAEVLGRCRKIRDGDHVISRTGGGGYTNEGFRALWQRTMVQWERSGQDRFTFHDIKRLADAAGGSGDSSNETEEPVEGYPQFDEVVRNDAAAMARHYKVFFCLEQSIRKLIVGAMEKTYGPDWWDGGKVNQHITAEVDALVAKEIDSGMKQRSPRMIDYTTFGQLREIIIQNWDVFDKHLVSKNAVGNVMATLNRLRGPIAHCCPISDHEADRLALAVKDWFNILR